MDHALGTVACREAIRQALDYKSIGRAAVVCLIAWFVSILMGIVFGAMLLMSAGSLFY